MTDKTAIEKAREALNILENVVPKNYDPQEPFDIEDLLDTVISRATLAKTTLSESLAALDAEKPVANEAWGVARQIYDGIASDLSRLSDTYVFNPFASACLIQQFAESYHAERCKEESAAILAASDRLGAALEESDKRR